MHQFNSLPMRFFTSLYFAQKQNYYTDTLLYYYIEKVILFRLPLHIPAQRRYKECTMHIFYPVFEVP